MAGSGVTAGPASNKLGAAAGTVNETGGQPIGDRPRCYPRTNSTGQTTRGGIRRQRERSPRQASNGQKRRRRPEHRGPRLLGKTRGPCGSRVESGPGPGQGSNWSNKRGQNRRHDLSFRHGSTQRLGGGGESRHRRGHSRPGRHLGIAVNCRRLGQIYWIDNNNGKNFPMGARPGFGRRRRRFRPRHPPPFKDTYTNWRSTRPSAPKIYWLTTAMRKVATGASDFLGYRRVGKRTALFDTVFVSATPPRGGRDPQKPGSSSKGAAREAPVRPMDTRAPIQKRCKTSPASHGITGWCCRSSPGSFVLSGTEKELTTNQVAALLNRLCSRITRLAPPDEPPQPIRATATRPYTVCYRDRGLQPGTGSVWV